MTYWGRRCGPYSWLDLLGDGVVVHILGLSHWGQDLWFIFFDLYWMLATFMGLLNIKEKVVPEVEKRLHGPTFSFLAFVY